MAARRAKPAGGSALTAADIMVREVYTVTADTLIADVAENFQVRNINGAPVVDEAGHLVGIVTEDDLVFGQMGYGEEEIAAQPGSAAAGGAAGEAPESGLHAVPRGPLRVSEIMTTTPIFAAEDTPIEEICGLLWRLRIHRVPIVRDGVLTGIISTTDICRIIADGRVRLSPGGPGDPDSDAGRG